MIGLALRGLIITKQVAAQLAELNNDPPILQTLCAKLTRDYRGDFAAGLPKEHIVVTLSRELKGRMELYLRWLSKCEKQAGENEPLGLILCAGKKQELVELLELDQWGIHGLEYLTELPPRKLLEDKLHQAIENVRERIENRGE